MASSSHYHYHNGDDDELDTVFDDIFEDADFIPEPKERKTYFYRETPRGRPQQALE